MLTLNGFACSLVHPVEPKEIRSFHPCVYQGWNVASCWVPTEQIVDTRHSPWPGFVVDFRKLTPDGAGRGWTVHMLCNGEPMVQPRFVDELGGGVAGAPSITIPFSPVFPSKTPPMSMVMQTPFGYEPPKRTQPLPGSGVIEIIVMPPGRPPVPFLKQEECASSGHIAYFKFPYAPLQTIQHPPQHHPQPRHAVALPEWMHKRDMANDWVPITRKRPVAERGTFPADLPADWMSDPDMRDMMEQETKGFLAMDWVRSLGGGTDWERTPRPMKTPVPMHRDRR